MDGNEPDSLEPRRRLKLRIPKNILPIHIIQAIEEIKKVGWPKQNNSTTYDLIYEGERYPPKIVVMYANKYANGELFDVNNFSGGEDTTNKFFRARGFEIFPKNVDNESKTHIARENLTLQRYQEYSRQDVHDIFDRFTPFTPRSGKWGIRGIISHPTIPNNFFFFVTFGHSERGFSFDESISESGILTWQSEQKQQLNDPVIQRLIHHDHTKNSIHLFLRADKFRNYCYLGKLAYLTHDNEREEPVHFKWQILDWELESDKAAALGLHLISDDSKFELLTPMTSGLIQTSPPEQKAVPTIGERHRDFIAKKVDFAEGEKKKKEIGIAGEELVIENEKKILTNLGLTNLVNHIEHVSKTQGDGAGFDIQSVMPNLDPKFIEVKTTVGGINTPFTISITELMFSQQYSKNYFLYRIYDYDKKSKSGKFYILQGDISKSMVLEPTQFNCKPHIKNENAGYFSP